MEYEGEDRINEMTGTSAVAGAGDDSETVPVHMDKEEEEKERSLEEIYSSTRR